MSTVVKASVALAVLVMLMSILIVVTGLHRSPPIGGLGGIAVAILLNIVVVIWALKRTAAETRYGGQLLNGLLIGVIAGVLIFAVSWIMLTLIPGYFEGIKEGNIEWLQASGLPEEQLTARIASIESATAVGQSFAGLVGTLATSVVIAAIGAIFLRKQ